MNVLALVDHPNHVCCRYRIAPFAAALAARGWTLRLQSLSGDTWSRREQLRAAEQADVVILQRKLLPLWQVRLLRKASRVLIYDFDDALFCRDSYSRKGPLSWARLAHFWATIYATDAVFAGNRFLQQQASQYVDPAKVFLLPTCVSSARYPLARHRRAGRHARLVWIGQHSTLPGLYQAEPHLAAAADRLPGLRLRVICNRFPQLAGVRVVRRVWNETTETAEVADADLGISWLPDDPWSRGKCGLKVLQYMAAGLPVIANPVGMNCEMIVHGENGFLVSTPAEWAEAIATLSNDPDRRAWMGAMGRQLLEERFSVERWAPRFAELVDQLGRGAVTINPSRAQESFF